MTLFIVIFSICTFIIALIAMVLAFVNNSQSKKFEKNTQVALSKMKQWTGTLYLTEPQNVFIKDFSGFLFIQVHTKNNSNWVFAYGITDGIGNFRIKVFGDNPQIQGHWDDDKIQQYINFAPQPGFPSSDPVFYTIWGISSDA